MDTSADTGPVNNTAARYFSRVVGCAFLIALPAVGGQFIGCATAETSRYVEHLTHVVQPSDQPDSTVVAAFDKGPKRGLTESVASVPGDHGATGTSQPKQ